MAGADLSFLSALLKRRSGLSLPPDKYRLVEPRLFLVARRFGFASVRAMLVELRHEPEALARAVTDAMTTNETSFFRDPSVFDAVRKTILPLLMRQRAPTRKIRIWCAGAATGQEPYSLAMLLAAEQAKLKDSKLEDSKLKNWHFDIVASDISTEAIARAKAGFYSQFEVQRGLSVEKLLGNFTQEDESWRIIETMRNAVRFRVSNLLDPLDWIGQADIIFCRNVLMYFDPATKLDVVQRLSDVLAPDGWLVLGRSETLPVTRGFIAAGARGCFGKTRGAIALAS